MKSLQIQNSPSAGSPPSDTPRSEPEARRRGDTIATQTNVPMLDQDALYGHDKLLAIYRKKWETIRALEEGRINPDQDIRLKFVQLEVEFMETTFDIDNHYNKRFNKIVYPESSK